MRQKPTSPQDVLSDVVERHASKKDAAAALGISLPYLCDLLRGRRDFSVRMLEKLGLQRTITVTRKGTHE